MTPISGSCDSGGDQSFQCRKLANHLGSDRVRAPAGRTSSLFPDRPPWVMAWCGGGGESLSPLTSGSGGG